ncbi:MAG: hypothetical protein J6X01_06845 [Bacteroidales bacterium]|nr:hypothetical protein [Bacteroidales bacterium]
MSSIKDRKERRSWWMQFLISVVGTAIGVGLTFAVSKAVENHNQEQAQRLTAMMVIHDIDETIDLLKAMKEKEDQSYNAAMFTMEHLDQMDSVPIDMIEKVLVFILADDQEFRFNTSNEKVFHSSQDTWKNIGSIKFIDNAQTFFYERQEVQEVCNKADNWQRPVTMKEYNMMNVENGILTSEETRLLAWKFLRDKLMDKKVQYFIHLSPWRSIQYKTFIDSWSRMNDENKFLMSITDEEMEDYVNKINRNGIAVTESSLVGTWIQSMTDGDSTVFEFHKDRTFTYVDVSTFLTQHPDFHGNVIIRISGKGTWTIEKDSLVRKLDADAYETEVDVSHVVVQAGKESSLNESVKDYTQYVKDYYIQYSKKNDRIVRLARLDASRNKMEWKGVFTNDQGKKEESVVYLKRKK